jgi:hypothetical protein
VGALTRIDDDEGDGAAGNVAGENKKPSLPSTSVIVTVTVDEVGFVQGVPVIDGGGD